MNEADIMHALYEVSALHARYWGKPYQTYEEWLADQATSAQETLQWYKDGLPDLEPPVTMEDMRTWLYESKGPLEQARDWLLRKWRGKE